MNIQNNQPSIEKKSDNVTQATQGHYKAKEMDLDLQSPTIETNKSTLQLLSQASSQTYEVVLSIKENILSDNKTNSGTFLCTICFTDYQYSEGISLSCSHLFCKTCIVEYLKQEMESFNLLKIRCPQANCSTLLKDSEAKNILSPTLFEAYSTKKMQKIRSKDFSLKYCPKPGCARVYTPKNGDFTKCECGTIICNKCFHEKHDNKTCLEVAQQEMELLGLGTDIKKCMICKTVVDRYEGCPHITCPVCDFEWCWICGREWDAGHSGRCLRYWSPKPPAAFLNGEFKMSVFSKIISIVMTLIEAILFVAFLMVGLVFLWPYYGYKQKTYEAKYKHWLVRLVVVMAMWPFVIV